MYILSVFLPIFANCRAEKRRELEVNRPGTSPELGRVESTYLTTEGEENLQTDPSNRLISFQASHLTDRKYFQAKSALAISPLLARHELPLSCQLVLPLPQLRLAGNLAVFLFLAFSDSSSLDRLPHRCDYPPLSSSWFRLSSWTGPLPLKPCRAKGSSSSGRKQETCSTMDSMLTCTTLSLW